MIRTSIVYITFQFGIETIINSYKFILVLILLVFSVFCFSQSADTSKINSKSLNLKISYNSSLIYPGARLGVEFPVQTSNLTKSKHGDEKNSVNDWFITGNVSWYHHPAFHDNVYFTAGWLMRRTKPKGFFMEFSPELGISRTYLGGTTYQVDTNGNVTIKKHAGYYYAFVSIGGGVGYDFSKTKLKTFMAYYKLNLTAMFPYNSTIYPRPAMEIGVIFKPPGFMSSKSKSKKN